MPALLVLMVDYLSKAGWGKIPHDGLKSVWHRVACSPNFFNLSSFYYGSDLCAENYSICLSLPSSQIWKITWNSILKRWIKPNKENEIQSAVSDLRCLKICHTLCQINFVLALFLTNLFHILSFRFRCSKAILTLYTLP